MSDNAAAGTAIRPHVVRVDDWTGLHSETLCSEAMTRLSQTVARGRPFRHVLIWSVFRDTAIQEMVRHAPGGLILIGTSLPFRCPRPFDEFFEPMRIRDIGMKYPVPEEMSDGVNQSVDRAHAWFGPIITWVALAVGVSMLAALVSLRSAAFVGAVPGMAILWNKIIREWLRGRHEWHVVPGAVFRFPPGAFGPRLRPQMIARTDAVAVVRPSGTIARPLLLEFWLRDGRRFGIDVTSKQATAVLAAWQSLQPPPTPEQVAAFVTGESMTAGSQSREQITSNS